MMSFLKTINETTVITERKEKYIGFSFFCFICHFVICTIVLKQT